MIRITKFYFVFLASLFCSPLAALAQTEKMLEVKNQTVEFVDEKVGTVFLRTEFIGEPSSKPTLFEVKIQCLGKKKKTLIKSWKSCAMEKSDFVRKERTLTIYHIQGRSHSNGSVKCDDPQVEEIDYSKACLKK